MATHPHAAVTRAWMDRAEAIRRLWHPIPFDGDEAGLDDPEDGECGAA